MATGLQVWDGQGNLEFDTTDAATRYFGQVVGVFPEDWNTFQVDIGAQRSSSAGGGMAVIVSAICQETKNGYTAGSDLSDLFMVDPLDGFVRVQRVIGPAFQIPPPVVITVDVLGVY